VIYSTVANKRVTVELPIFLIEEYIAAIVPALGYVVWVVNGYRSGNAWHGWIISRD
jgi:hypothetical protein